MQYIIFTDGASRGNPGPGGWGAIIIAKSGNDEAVWNVKEIGGADPSATNNKMEMKAAKEALEATEANCEAVIYTDSSYLLNGITKWVNGWKRNGWKTKTKEDVQNSDLWRELDALKSSRQVSWKHVSGHAGVSGNMRCDEIATSFADGGDAVLYSGPLSGYQIKNVLDVSHDPVLQKNKGISSSRAKAKAFSYVSSVGGKIETHRTWAECEKRVRGAKGARYKKALSREEEETIKKEFEND